MKRIFLGLCLVLLFLPLSLPANGIEFAGGYIRIEGLKEAAKYRVELVLFRNCAGPVFSNSELITVTRADGEALPSFSVELDSTWLVASPIPGQNAPCGKQNGGNSRMEGARFRGYCELRPNIADLDYTLSLSGCCRASSANVESETWQISTTLYPNLYPRNHSPKLGFSPIQCICALESCLLKPDFHDEDQDKLGFEWVDIQTQNYGQAQYYEGYGMDRIFVQEEGKKEPFQWELIPLKPKQHGFYAIRIWEYRHERVICSMYLEGRISTENCPPDR